MIVGASGLGKSTFVNTFCEYNIFPPKDYENPEKQSMEQTVSITPVSVGKERYSPSLLLVFLGIYNYFLELEEDGIKLQLTVIDTPGFGDNINNEGCFNDIVGYIEKQYDDILAEESRIKRNPKFQGILVLRMVVCIYSGGFYLNLWPF